MHRWIWGLVVAVGSQLGCEPTADVAEMPEPKKIEMPALTEHPKELTGLWKLANGSKLELKPDGSARNTAVITGPTGVRIEPKTTEGRWGIDEKQLFLELDGTAVAYDYKLQPGKLRIGKGRIQFDYER